MRVRKAHPWITGLVLIALTIIASPPRLRPAAFAAPVAPGAPATPGGPTRDAASAQQAARATGRPVEIPSARTESSTVYANPSGTLTMELSAVPERVRASTGAWTAISARLRPAANGWFRPEATLADVRFSAGGSGPFVAMRQGDEEFTLSWPGALPAPTMSGDTVVYASVLPDIDLRVTATATGFSHFLVVRSAHAAANPALRAVRLGMGGSARVSTQADGALTVTGNDGTVMATAAPARMWDSRADAGRKSARVGVRPAGRDLVLTPDPALLTDPAARYPIVIDPSYNRPGYVRWAFANSANENNDTTDARVGRSPDSGAIYRSFFEFSPNSGTMSLRGTRILGAKLRTKLNHSWSCDATDVSLFRTAGITSTPRSTWSPALQAHLHRVTPPSAHEGSPCNNADRDVEFAGSLASDLQSFASNTPSWSSYTVALSAASNTAGAEEGAESLWKRFYPAQTKLVVDFNSRPKTPTSASAEGKPCVTGAGRPAVASTTPPLRAVVDDPDVETDLRAKFTWERWNGSIWVAAGTATVTNHRNRDTALHRVSAALTGGGVYRFRVQTGDPWSYAGASGIDWSTTESANCEFSIDTTPPQHVPEVSSPVYREYVPDVEDGYFGSVGRTEGFTFDAGGDLDVVGYRWGWQDPPTTYVAAPSPGAPLTLALTPPPPYEDEPASAGQQVLYVSSVDRAGLSSEKRTYAFRVAAGTGPNGRWDLTEPTGAAQFADTADAATVHPLNRMAVTGGAPSILLTGPPASTFNGATSHGVGEGGVVDTTRSFTVAAWVRLTALTGSSAAVAQNGVRSSGFELGYRSGVGWSFQMHGADTDNPAVARASYLYVGPSRWALLAGVYDAGERQLKLYVDGTLTSSAAHTAGWNAQSSVTVGASRFNGAYRNFLPGDIADVRMWDRAVPAAQIGQFAGVQQARWSLEGDGYDLTEQGHVTTPVGGVTWGPGKQGDGAILNGTGYLVSSGPVVRTDQSYTVSAWVNPSAFGDHPTILSQCGTQRCAFYLQYQPSSGRWAIVLPSADNVATATYYSASSAVVPSLNAWAHLVGVYDASRGVLQLYVNGGAPVTTVAIPGMWHASGNLYIGRADTGVFVTGAIDDVRVFAGALPASEVAKLYQP